VVIVGIENDLLADGALEQPRHLVVGVDPFEVDDATDRGAHVPRGFELDGGHLAQFGVVDAALRGSGVVGAEGGVDRAPFPHPLAAGTTDHRREGDCTEQGGDGGDHGGRPPAGAGIGCRARGRDDGCGRHGLPEGGPHGQEFARVDLVVADDKVARTDAFGGAAAGVAGRTGVALEVGEFAVGRDVDLDAADRDRPAIAHGVPPDPVA